MLSAQNITNNTQFAEEVLIPQLLRSSDNSEEELRHLFVTEFLPRLAQRHVELFYIRDDQQALDTLVALLASAVVVQNQQARARAFEHIIRGLQRSYERARTRTQTLTATASANVSTENSLAAKLESSQWPQLASLVSDSSYWLQDNDLIPAAEDIIEQAMSDIAIHLVAPGDEFTRNVQQNQARDILRKDPTALVLAPKCSSTHWSLDVYQKNHRNDITQHIFNPKGDGYCGDRVICAISTIKDEMSKPDAVFDGALLTQLQKQDQKLAGKEARVKTIQALAQAKRIEIPGNVLAALKTTASSQSRETTIQTKVTNNEQSLQQELASPERLAVHQQVEKDVDAFFARAVAENFDNDEERLAREWTLFAQQEERTYEEKQKNFSPELPFNRKTTLRR